MKVIRRGKMEKPKQLSDRYTQEILHEIQAGIYAHADRLPSEPDIAKRFGISRTMVRDCLSILEREGFISRKHGVGTIINQHVLKVKVRIDLEQEFLDMIRGAGYEAAIAFVHVSHEAADEQVAKKLRINSGEGVVVSKRLITADGKPAIHCSDYIAERSIAVRDYDLNLLKKPVFEFIKEYCDTEIYMDLSEVSAVAADAEMAENFGVEMGSPLLYIDEVGYNFVGQPILYSKEHYADGILKHTILRKKI
jgi:GntR family transcriptional regulator